MRKLQDTLCTLTIIISSETKYTSFHPKLKMNLLECYNFEEDIDKENGFTWIQPQGYLKLIDNLKILSNLIPHSKP